MREAAASLPRRCGFMQHQTLAAPPPDHYLRAVQRDFIFYSDRRVRREKFAERLARRRFVSRYYRRLNGAGVLSKCQHSIVVLCCCPAFRVLPRGATGFRAAPTGFRDRPARPAPVVVKVSWLAPRLAPRTETRNKPPAAANRFVQKINEPGLPGD